MKRVIDRSNRSGNENCSLINQPPFKLSFIYVAFLCCRKIIIFNFFVINSILREKQLHLSVSSDITVCVRVLISANNNSDDRSTFLYFPLFLLPPLEVGRTTNVVKKLCCGWYFCKFQQICMQNNKKSWNKKIGTLFHGSIISNGSTCISVL